MMLVRWTPEERAHGEQLGQWLAGCMGAIITTLPAFVVLPVFYVICHNWKIVDADGEENHAAAGCLTFFAGIAVWGIAALVLHA